MLNLSGISIERLSAFCDIVAAGSVVAASKKTGVAQGQYSRQIRDLERAFGVRLFVKDGRFLRVSREGVRLAALTRAYFDELATVAGAETQRALRLGAAESIMRWTLIPHYTEVLAALGTRLDVQNHRTTEILDRVQSGDLDLGIVRLDAITEDFDAETFPTTRHAFMVPRSVLPDKSASGIQGVTRLPLVMLDSDGAFVRSVSRFIAEAGLPVAIVGRAESFSLAIELAKILSAATVVPAPAVREFPADVFAAVQMDGLAKLDRPMAIVVSKQAAQLNAGPRRAAARLSRLFSE